MTTPRDRIEQIKARYEAATEGPWKAITTGAEGGDHWYVVAHGESLALIHANDGMDEDQRQPDADFIAHARNDLPDMVAFTEAMLDLAKSWDFPEPPYVPLRNRWKIACANEITALAEKHLGKE